ncbi:glycosyltransferase [Buttiauxella gaviniae]|uniref:Glycosyltransferase n=1 Tax=Buttiauxella gaviniae TaxID=82990 RepID=A0ABV3NXV1_9ENTR
MNFSVLMSLYNKELPQYLNECLLSLHSQTLKADEVVIVFDGHVGYELENIVNNWMHQLPIKIVKLETSVGLGQALNAGLKECTYDIICRMDTDDICAIERFSTQISFLNSHPDIYLMGSNVVEFMDSRTIKGNIKEVPSDYKEILKFAKTRNPFNHMTVVFNKNVVQEVGGYKHHLYMEDYNLWLRILAKGYKAYNFSEPLVFARAGSNMVKRRHGYNYLLSELKLAKLKIKLGIQTKIAAYWIFILRGGPRIMPLSFLGIIYGLLRKKTGR